QKMMLRIRLHLLRHLFSLSADYHDSASVGETMSRIEQDVDQIGGLGGDFIPNCLRLILVTAMVLITMLVMNWRFSVLLFPIFLLLRFRYRILHRHYSDVVRAYQGRVTSLLQEYLAGVVQVQLLTRELAVTRRFAKLAGDFIRAQSVLRKNNQEFSMLSLSVI